MKILKCAKCSRCGRINPERALEGGLCWLCSGDRRPPTALRDRPPADMESSILLQRELNMLQSRRIDHVREELDDPTHSDQYEQGETHAEPNT